MRVLALDTTTRTASFAVIEDDRVLAERIGDPAQSHAARLPGEALAVLRDAALELASIDVFAVAAGPGSFTGLRIGIAAVQGLAVVQRRRIVPVSVLEALAQVGSLELSAGDQVAAWVDAHRGEVFAALYRVADRPAFTSARLEQMAAPIAAAPHVVLERWSGLGGGSRVFIGDGALLYSGAVDGHGVVVAPPPLAATIARIAVHRAAAGDAVDPASVQPIYVRRPDAELARDRRIGI